MSETQHPKGLLDTSIVIDLAVIEQTKLPIRSSISAITLAELTAGPHAAKDSDTQALRQELLQRVERTFDPLPFDDSAARSYGSIYSAVLNQGRKARGARAVDLLIAAVARSNNLPLYTRNPKDFANLEKLITVVAV